MIIIIQNVRLNVMINMITVNVIMCLLAVIMLGMIRSTTMDMALSHAVCDTHTIIMLMMRQLMKGIVVCVSVIMGSLLILKVIVSIIMVIRYIEITEGMHLIVVTLLIVNSHAFLRTMGVQWW